MVPTRSQALPDAYFRLIRELPLRSIRSESELDAAQAMVNRLLRQRLDRGARLYLDALTDLIETYEGKAHPIPDASEAELLQMLMDSNGVSQSELARQVGISQSTLSAVLGGARTLTKDQVVSLARRFRLSPAAFLPAV